MKKHFYLFSSMALLTTIFGLEKANSYNLDKGFIATDVSLRDGKTTNGLMTNTEVYSHDTNLAYTGSDQLEAYWYGVGIGIAETLCFSTANGYISNNVAKNMMSDYRNIYGGEKEFRSKTFEEGIKLAIDGYPGCRL